MSPALLKIAALARDHAALTRGPDKARWLAVGKKALAAYRRWRKLSDAERRQFEDGPLKPYVDQVAASAQQVFVTARDDRAALGSALLQLVKSLQALLDVMVVRFDPGLYTSGALTRA